MNSISNYITKKNNAGEKVLSVFLTSGFPDKENFSELALKLLETGADMLEIGFPFSDPLADGPVIQLSSNIALKNKINLETTFRYVNQIKKGTDKPLILMGYANPVLNYGIDKFAEQSKKYGVDGIIIPDIPIEEYSNFFNSSFKELDVILLVTPTTSPERIHVIDEKSKGFIYCVSVKGTTGEHKQTANENLNFVKNTYSLMKKNKMLVGFGISNEQDVLTYSPFCDGVIVGSAIIKSLMDEIYPYKNTIELVKKLKSPLLNNVKE